MTTEGIPKCLCGLQAVLHARSSLGQKYYQCPKGSMDPTGCSFFLAYKEAPSIDVNLTKIDGASGQARVVSHERRDDVEQEEHSIPMRRSVHDTASDDQLKTNDYTKNIVCFQCGGHGHVAKDCPLMEQKPVETHEWAKQGYDRRNASSSGTCFYCKEVGHFAKECPQKQKDTQKRRTCFRCRQVGHWASQCPEKRTRKNGAATTPEAREDVEHHGVLTANDQPPPQDQQQEREPAPPPQQQTQSPRVAEKRKPDDAIEMPPPKIPSMYPLKQPLPVNMDVRKLPLSMRGGGSYTR